METRLLTDALEAARLLKSGALVAFPTETVFGLGAHALDEDAVARIFTAKGRPADNPLIVHVASREQVSSIAASLTPCAEALLEAFSPGPLTVVVHRSAAVPDIVSAGLDTVGIRIPAHPVARELLELAEIPVAAPSANRSGRPSPTTWEAVLKDLDGRIDAILQGPRSEVGLESSVIDCTGEVPVMLRAGSITEKMVRSICGSVERGGTEDHRVRRSPGTRHPHYRPSAEVRIVDRAGVGGAAVAFIGMDPAGDGYGLTNTCSSVDAYAYALYDFFRSADAAGMTTIECQRVAPRGLGRALMDRIERAASP